MRTIRRLYTYLVTAIALEVVLWGVINLVRAMLDTTRVGGGSGSALAGALATIIVGLPVFLLHWWLAQRPIETDADERGSGVRAIFLYGLLFALIVPIAQNALAVMDRTLVDLFGVSPEFALFGFDQTLIDNGIALLMNAGIAAYFLVVLRRDWRAGTEAPEGGSPAFSPDNLVTARRVFRYALVAYSLGLLVVGVQQLLRYVFDQAGPPNINALAPFANGLSFTVFGAALFWSAWRVVQDSLAYAREHRSLLRLVFLYLLLLIGLGTVLTSLGEVIYQGLLALFGNPLSFADWLLDVSGPLSAAVPFAALWFYFSTVLRSDREELPGTPRREGLWRVYRALLAFTGLIVTFIAMQNLGSFIVDRIGMSGRVIDSVSRTILSSGLAGLIIGVPLWIRTWVPFNAQALGDDAAGERARRSTVRKAYLYLAVFIGVVGVMASAGGLIFQLLSLVLGDGRDITTVSLLQQVKTLLLFILLLFYHWRFLRGDTQRAARNLAEQYSLFPVLVLDPGSETFAETVVAAIREEAEEIPVAVHFTSTGAPGEDLSNAGAVVLPAALAANPPEALRIWLRAFEGQKIVVPLREPGWVWIDADPGSPARMGRMVAGVIRKLAEGERLADEGRTSPWLIVAAVFGGLIGLSILISAIAALIDF